MNKCTLLIDGNWLLMSRFFNLSNGFRSSNPDYEKESSQKELEELLVRSINVVLNRFYGTVDNIILITDGGSWRKQLPIPFSLDDETYKGNRSQTADLDWNYIYGALDNIYKRFEELGITCCRDNNIEGDDWCWYWSRRLNDDGVNCIIWSSDNDLKQLIQVQNLSFTAWYNDRNGIFFHNSLEETPGDDIDFFMSQQKENALIKSLKKQANNFSYINPEDIVMDKIVCGDAGDNIKSLIRVRKGNRTYKVGEKEWLKCKQKLNINSLTEFFDSSNNLITELLSNPKYRGHQVDEEVVREMFDYNKKLVWLNEKVIPDTIIYNMNEVTDYKEYDLSYIRNNFKVLLRQDNKMIEDLFSGI